VDRSDEGGCPGSQAPEEGTPVAVFSYASRVHRVVLAALLLSACQVEDSFFCSSDEQCRRAGKSGGTCEASSYCSFADIDCESGRRYDALAAESNQCVLDGDKDMIADDADNCVDKPNPEQFDEDGDGWGDLCDPCPPFSDNVDLDGDGVGGLCDPRPNTPGDSIAYFEGFHTALLNWSATSGSAAVVNDALVTQGRTNLDLPVMSTGRAILLAGVTMVQQPTNGVWLGLPYQDGIGGNYCELTTTILELSTQEATMTPVPVKEVNFTARVGESYVFGIERAGLQQYRCLARSAQATDDTSLIYDGLSDSMTDHVGLGADASTRFAWVMIVHE
jgi:hypothetical protein